MKRFIQRLGYWLSLFSLVLVSCLGFLGWTQPGFAVEAGLQPTMMLADVPLCAVSDQKIDFE